MIKVTKWFHPYLPYRHCSSNGHSHTSRRGKGIEYCVIASHAFVAKSLDKPGHTDPRSPADNWQGWGHQSQRHGTYATLKVCNRQDALKPFLLRDALNTHNYTVVKISSRSNGNQFYAIQYYMRFQNAHFFQSISVHWHCKRNVFVFFIAYC